jgi:hypothetical protein
MQSKTLREWALFAAMSLFVAWHSFAMLVAPGADDAQGLRLWRDMLHPYLSFLSLDNNWGFFAPNVRRGYQFRYVIQSADGVGHTFVPTEEVSWYGPDYWWLKLWQIAILEDPDKNGDLAGALFCRKHAALHPTTVTLITIEQKDFSPGDWLNGKRPFDPDFTAAEMVTRVECPP